MATQTTPGVYINEVDGFSNSVVGVPTAIPVFIGYTEYAKAGNQSLLNVPTSVSSMLQFQSYYASPTAGTGGAPQPKFNYSTNSTTVPPCTFDSTALRFNLYYHLQLFFANGGSNCYIVSIGSYDTAMANGVSEADYQTCFTALEQFAEPTMVVMPDAMLLDASDWTSVSQSALLHCNLMQNRIAIFDVLNGYLPPDGSANDPIKGTNGNSGFYTVNGLGEAFNKYGVAYYPWLNTNIVPSNTIDYSWLTSGTLATFIADLNTESATLFPPINSQPNPKLAPYLAVIAALTVPPPTSALDPTGAITQQSNNSTMMKISPLYQQTMADICTSVNMLAPSGAMAGVITRNDNTFGVFQSPANTTIINGVSPTVNLSDADQGDLNEPLNGLAVNAIRTFPNLGMLVWGARTMAGNSDDWRYICVRRTMIFLEQSIKVAMQAFVFQTNDSLTWIAVSSTIENFLNTQWKAGALQGAKPTDAYSVSVGLGSTMTGEDILQGFMRVTVLVAVSRPAEFIVLTFQQQMQTS